jgi:hypothetical protein
MPKTKMGGKGKPTLHVKGDRQHKEFKTPSASHKVTGGKKMSK